MHRRDTLRRGALLGATGGLGLLAGCTGSSEETDEKSAASLSVENFDYEEGDSGKLVVTVDVRNSGSSEGSGRLYVTVTAAETTSANESEDGGGSDGDGTVAARKSREVTVPAGETKTVTLSFDIGYDQFLQKGSLNVDFRT